MAWSTTGGVAVMYLLQVMLTCIGLVLSPPPDAVEKLEAPIYMAHRGGCAAFAENTMAGFKASAASGFPVEFDLQALPDGTLVCDHDRADPTAVRFAEVLDELGWQAVLVPEIKPGAEPYTQEIIAMIRERELGWTVIIQTREIELARQCAKAGLHVLYLGYPGEPITPEQLSGAGIEFVGLSRGAPAWQVKSMIEGGIKVMIWTVNDPTEAGRLMKTGVAGVFTDNPWRLEERGAL